MHIVTVAQSAAHATHWDSWRQQARALLQAGARPEDIAWNEGAQQVSLFSNTDTDQVDATDKPPNNPANVVISKAFLELAHRVAAHSESTRWALLYRMLWRQTLGGERALLAMATDSDVRQAGRWAKAVGRDIHKMHAFVRFRRVDNSLPEQPSPTMRSAL